VNDSTLTNPALAIPAATDKIRGNGVAGSTPKIEIRGLVKSFGEKRVLRGLDLDIERAAEMHPRSHRAR
jgi:hypothetical protein